MASMCFLCSIGARGSVFIASVNNLVNRPFLSWAKRSKVDVRNLKYSAYKSMLLSRYAQVLRFFYFHIFWLKTAKLERGQKLGSDNILLRMVNPLEAALSRLELLTS